MNPRNHYVPKEKTSKRTKNTPLHVEQLEARLMMAADAIELGLQAFSSSHLQNDAQPALVGEYGFGNTGSSGATNQPPTIARPLSLATGTVVTTKTARASILGADDGGERRLSYQWSILSAPEGSGMTFSTNNSNRAKNVTLRFNRAGEYEIMVTVVDKEGQTATSSLRFTVQQVLTSLQVFTASGQLVNTRNGVNTTSVDPVFRVQGIDQFGQNMAQTPSAVWTLRGGPRNGSMEQTTEGEYTSFTFSRNGNYNVQATVANRMARFRIQNTRIVSHIELIDVNGQQIQDGVPVQTSEADTSLILRLYDQNGREFTTLPSVSWGVQSAPSGGNARVTMRGSEAQLEFDKAGDYELTVLGSGKVRRANIKVAATLTTLVISPDTATLEAGQSQQFSVHGLDQFGRVMASTPSVTWTATGGTISTSGVFTAGQTAGAGTVTATSGSISSTVDITVTDPAASVPTILQILDSNGNLLNEIDPIQTGGTQVAVKIRVIDQYGQIMSEIPNMTWSTNTAPTNGNATVVMNAADATITLNRTGNYELTVTGGGLSRTLKVRANATATTLQILNGSNQLVNEVDPVQTSGTNTAVSVRYLDQFGQTMTNPAVTWTTNSAPTNGTATVAMNGAVATVTLNRVGDYQLTVSGGGLSRKVNVRANATATAIQVLDGGNQLVNEVDPVQTSGTNTAVTLRTLDQFGQTMTNPSVTWTTNRAPANGTATVAMNGAVATVTLNRVGDYDLTVSGGGVSRTVKVKANATLTSLQVNPNSVSVQTGMTHQFQVAGLDQFGQVMSSVPSVTWSTNRGSITSAGLFTAGNEAAIGTVTAQTATLSASASVTITLAESVPTVLQVLDGNGNVLNEVDPVETSGTNIGVTIRVLDQYGQSMTNPTLSWTTNSAPSNGTASVAMNGAVATVTLNRAGDYQLTVSGGGLSRKVNVRANATATTLQVLNGSNQLVNEVDPVQTSGTNTAVTMRTLDQFGQVMTNPTLTWTTNSAPTNGTASVAMNGAVATVTLNRVGDYQLTVSGGGLSRKVNVRANATATTLQVLDGANQLVNEVDPVQTSGTNTAVTMRTLDQFGQVMTNPTLTWTTNSAPSNGTASVAMNGAVATVTLNRVGDYQLTVSGGGLSRKVNVRTIATATTLQVLDGANQLVNEVDPVQTSGTNTAVTMRTLDQFGQVMANPTLTWTTNSAPTNGTASVAMNGAVATVTLNRVGDYQLTVSGGGLSRKLNVRANATLTSLQVTPGTVSVQTNATQQFQVQGIDQFGQIMASAPSVTWSASGGTVSTSGLFTAGATAGNGSVTAQSGTLSASASITVTAPPVGPFQDAALSQLIQTYFVDQLLDRTEMMAILRSVGNDSTVSSVELNDLRTLVSSTEYVMPNHVRGLARNVVTTNNANLKFQGQNAGNLAAGSSSTLLNNLVDKWFLGVDRPALAGTATGYTLSTGILFNVSPSMFDSKQGMIGDCYFLASVSSIAAKNPQAIRDMFDDNGDGTYTVRFFGRNSSGVATADYVTVDRRLPTHSNAILSYAGYGFSATSATTVLWIALAEKAYAQWNETGRAGRNGTNTYSGIEGGWMHNVNFQVLGYNSTNYSFSSSTQQTLINAIQSGLAVTAGTKSSVASGLVAGHAYNVTGYNSNDGTFTLFNPWGNTHPAPQTWAQLQASFTIFTTTDPTGSGDDVSSGGFGSSVIVMAAQGIELRSVAIAASMGTCCTQEVLQSSAGSSVTWLSVQSEDATTPSSDWLAASESVEDSDASSEASDGSVEERVLKDLALMELYMDSLLS